MKGVCDSRKNRDIRVRELPIVRRAAFLQTQTNQAGCFSLDWAVGVRCLDSIDWEGISMVRGLSGLTTGLSRLETKKYLPYPKIKKLHTK